MSASTDAALRRGPIAWQNVNVTLEHRQGCRHGKWCGTMARRATLSPPRDVRAQATDQDSDRHTNVTDLGGVALKSIVKSTPSRPESGSA